MRNFRVIVNGNEYKVAIEELAEDAPQPAAPKAAVSQPAAPKPTSPTPAAPSTPQASQPQPAATSGTVVAPMPGTILKVHVTRGDSVTKGQTLLVLEAMKMENEIMAPVDGVVQGLNVAEGASVNAGDVLIVLG